MEDGGLITIHKVASCAQTKLLRRLTRCGAARGLAPGPDSRPCLQAGRLLLQIKRAQHQTYFPVPRSHIYITDFDASLK